MKEHPFAVIKGNKIFRKGFLEFPDREIGEVRENAESSIEYFESRFEIVENKVKEIENSIETGTNKGSFLMKLVHLKENLANFDGIGDFEKLYFQLDNKEKFLHEIIHQNRLKNYEVKKALLKELESLKDHFNLKEAADRIRELKQNWIKTGAVLDEYKDEFDTKFSDYLSHFNKRKEAYFEDKKHMIQDKIKKYQDIIKRAENIVKLNDIKKSSVLLKQLQHEWKNLGRIPADSYEELKGKFKRINDTVFDQLRDLKDETNENRLKVIQQTIDQKTQLLKELSERINHGEEDLSKLKKDFIYQWKNLGRIFNKEIHQLNEKFGREIMRINELLFIDKIAGKKNHSYKQLDTKTQNQIKIQILHELIERDEKDLSLFNRNMEVFNLRPGSADKIFNNKMQDRIKSLQVKKEILESLKSDLNKK